MLRLEPSIRQALLDIQFVPRYEALLRAFSAARTPMGERLRYLDGEIVMETIRNLGYGVSFEPREKFFRIPETQAGGDTVSAHIILEGGMADMVWVVRKEGRLLLGLPLGEYSRLLIRPDYRIKKPVFGTYEDLDEILRRELELFGEFCRAIACQRETMPQKA